MRTQTALLIAGAAALGLGQTMAQAQASESGFHGLEEITVTAQKRSENLQKVPFAITALNPTEMERLQISGAKDLAGVVPGLVIHSIGGNALPFIRGLGVRSSGPWQEPGVGTYIDGVYFQHSTISNVLLNNLQRIEVLKGPQGTLFGRNAVGGVISYVTRDPQQTASADLTLGLANYNAWSGSLYATTGITDNIAADVAITSEDQSEGWGTNLYSGEDAHTARKYSIRSKWLLTLSDATRFTLIGDFARASSAEAGVGTVRGIYPFITIGPSHVGGFYDTYLPTEPKNELTTYGVSLKAEHDMGWGQLVSISALRRDLEAKNLPYGGFVSPYLPETPHVGQLAGLKTETDLEDFNRTFTQEFQVLSPEASSIKWVGGVYVLLNNAGFNFKNDNRITATGLQNIRNVTSQETESYSGFFQATMPIFTDTRLTAGARYTSDDRRVKGYAERNTVANQNVYTLIPGRSDTDNPMPRGTWSKPTFKIALEHDLTDEIFTYASFSTGFQSAYYSISSSASIPPLEPETLKAYEVGMKADLFDNRLRANISVFLYDLENVVVSHAVDGSQVTDNAAKSENKGVDLDIILAPIENLTLTAGMSYVDATYTDYKDALHVAPDANGTAWVDVGPFDDSGRPLSITEKFMGSFIANYVIPTPKGDFSIVGSVAYHSGLRFDSQDLNVQPSYTKVNASLGWTAPDGRYDVRLWGKNLTNEKVANFFPNNTIMMYTVEAPRTYGLRFTRHWN